MEKDSQDCLIVGTSADYPPFSYREKGQLVGYEIEFIAALGKVLDKKVVIKDMDFSTLIPALKAGQVDMVIACVSKTPLREKHVDFSGTYYVPSLAVITKNRAENSVTWDHKTVGVQLGSLMDQYLTEKQKVSPLKIIRFNKTYESIQDLNAGRLDYVLIEGIQAKTYVQKNPGLYAFGLSNPSQGYAVVTEKNSDLTTQVNDGLEKLKQQGVLDDLNQKWIEAR